MNLVLHDSFWNNVKFSTGVISYKLGFAVRLNLMTVMELEYDVGGTWCLECDWVTTKGVWSYISHNYNSDTGKRMRATEERFTELLREKTEKTTP